MGHATALGAPYYANGRRKLGKKEAPMEGLLDVRPDSDYCDMGSNTITLFEPVNGLLN
jgi:hypothetical protein